MTAVTDTYQMTSIFQLAKQLSSRKTVEELLTLITKQVTSCLQAERCSIFLLDFEQNEIWSKVATGTDDIIRFPRGSGIAGVTIETGRPVLVTDAYSDPRFNRNVDAETGFKTHDLLSIPLINLDGKVIGCFEVINSKKNEGFSDDDIEFLKAFGSYATIAIETTKAFEERELAFKELKASQQALYFKIRQLEVVYELEKSISNFEDFDLFMQGAISNAVEICNSEGGSILLYNEKDNRFLFSYRVGEKSDALKDFTLNPTEGIAGFVFSNSKTILENDAQNSQHLASHIDRTINYKTKNIIAVPLFESSLSEKSKKSVGVIEILNSKNGYFSIDDQTFLELIANQISTMLTRVRQIEKNKEVQRMSMLGQLASTIVHDFKNPMTVIKGMAEVVSEDTTSVEKRHKYCSTMIAQVDRCINMMSEILMFAKGDATYEFKKLNVKDFLNDVASLLEHETKLNNIQFEKNFVSESFVSGDPEKLQRVIFNITNNAIAALKKSGNLSISSKNIGDQIEIRISDNGPGIPAEIQDKIFDLFFSHGKSGGTGLGLYIAKDVMQKHKGSIGLDKSVPQGATFVLKIPMVRSS